MSCLHLNPVSKSVSGVTQAKTHTHTHRGIDYLWQDSKKLINVVWLLGTKTFLGNRAEGGDLFVTKYASCCCFHLLAFAPFP